jgi:hypothetical protein
MEFNFGTQPQKKSCKETKIVKTYSLARIAAGTVPSHECIQAPKIILK